MSREGRTRARMPARRLLALVLGPLVVATGVFLVLVPPRMNRLVDQSAELRTLGVARVLADLIAPTLEFESTEDAQRALALLDTQREAVGALVLDGHGAPFAHWPAAAAPIAASPGPQGLAAVPGALIARVPFAAPGGTRGTLAIRFASASVEQQKRTNWIIALVVSAILLALGAAFTLLVARFLARRDRAEQALEDEAAKFRTLVEGMPDALVIHRGGALIYANPAAQALLDLEVVGGGGRRGREVLLRGAGDAPGELELSLDGKAQSFELHAFSLGLDGEPATIALARDVTERRRLHERLAVADRLASIGTLAAGVAHEINNPLTYILSNVDYVASELDDLGKPTAAGDVMLPAASIPGLREAIDDARTGATRVQRIVQDMKKLARGEAGERSAIDVRRPLESATKMLGAQLQRRARLEVTLGEVPAVLASESQLVQVFINLLGNAADALSPDAPAERRIIRVATGVAASGHVEVRVSDTGSGISPEVRDKIFDAFFTTKAVGVGTGLGLSISHTIISSMGGSMTLETEVGVGTTFIVQLPPAPSVGVGPKVVAASPDGAVGRILVVDDDQAVADAAARVLARHQVSIETSPIRALDRLRDGDRFDLILCDVRMPGMTGPELRAALARSNPAQAATLVFMTGASEAREQAELEALGVPVLEKPFDRSHLSEFVSSQMARLERAA